MKIVVKNCIGCPFHRHELTTQWYSFQCHLYGKDQFHFFRQDYLESIPEWCPLQDFDITIERDKTDPEIKGEKFLREY